MQKVCTQTNLLTPWCELAWNCWACAPQSRMRSTAPFYGPVSPAHPGRKNWYFFRTIEVLLLGPYFAVGFYCGNVWKRDLLGPTFPSGPLQSHATTMHMQTSNRQCMRRARADVKSSMLVLFCARADVKSSMHGTCCSLLHADVKSSNAWSSSLRAHLAHVWNCGFLGFLSVVGREGCPPPCQNNCFATAP